jgi:hypothetical protein
MDHSKRLEEISQYQGDLRYRRNALAYKLINAPDGWMDKYLENWELIS